LKEAGKAVARGEMGGRMYLSKSPQSKDPPVIFDSAGNVKILTLSSLFITRSPLMVWSFLCRQHISVLINSVLGNKAHGKRYKRRIEKKITCM